MSLVCDKTLEVVRQYGQPDYLDKCKNTFVKYSKFYKEEDVTEILSHIVGSLKAIIIFIQVLDLRRDSDFYAELFSKALAEQMNKKRSRSWVAFVQKISTREEQEVSIEAYEVMRAHIEDDVEIFHRKALLSAIDQGQVAVVIHILNSMSAESVEGAFETELMEAVKAYENKCLYEEEEYDFDGGDVFIFLMNLRQGIMCFRREEK